jgi:peptide/nickel transport system substrate-binding protein
MTFDRDITIPLLKDVRAQVPNPVCQLSPTNVSTNLAVNSAAPPFDNPQIRKRWR